MYLCMRQGVEGFLKIQPAHEPAHQGNICLAQNASRVITAMSQKQLPDRTTVRRRT